MQGLNATSLSIFRETYLVRGKSTGHWCPTGRVWHSGTSPPFKTLAGCGCVSIKAAARELPTILLDLLPTGILPCMETGKYQGSAKKV